jgi:hypothetical protein
MRLGSHKFYPGLPSGLPELQYRYAQNNLAKRGGVLAFCLIAPGFQFPRLEPHSALPEGSISDQLVLAPELSLNCALVVRAIGAVLKILYYWVGLER